MKRLFVLIPVFLLLISCEDSTNENRARGPDEIVITSTNKNMDDIYQKVAEKRATDDEILKIFESSDPESLSNVLGVLIMYRGNDMVLETLKSVWFEETADNPSFSWELLRSPSVKLSIASSLYTLDSENSHVYLEYVRQQMDTGNSDAKFIAALKIGIIGGNRDIPVLKKIIFEEDGFVMSGAVNGLAEIGTPESKKALEEMTESGELEQSKIEYILRILMVNSN